MEQTKPRRSRLEGAWTLVASALLVACGTPSGDLRPGGTAATRDAQPSSITTAATSAGGVYLAVDGFTLPVPQRWLVQDRAVIGTAFQRAARSCDAAETVDRPAPSDAGSPELTRAAVQICVIARDDDLSLEQWLAGRSQETSTPARYGACEVRLLPGRPELQLAYAQSSDRRAEIATTVTTTPDLTDQRRQEVADLLTNMRCPMT